MNGIQCKEELDLEKNINNLPKMVKKSKSKIPKSKRICQALPEKTHTCKKNILLLKKRMTNILETV